MPNPHRAEMRVKIEDETWTMRGSLDALAAIEEATGRGIASLVMRFMRGEYGIREIVAVIDCGIHAGHGGDGPDEAAIRRAIDDGGFALYAGIAVEFLALALDGKGKRKTRRAPAKKAQAPGTTG